MKINITIKRAPIISGANFAKNSGVIKECLEKGGSAPFKIFVCNEEKGGLLAFFETEEKENCLGRVIVSDKEKETLIQIIEGDYAVSVTFVNEKGDMEAFITTEEVLNKKTSPVKIDEDLLAFVKEGYMTQENLEKRVAIATEHGMSMNILKKFVFENIRKRGIKEELSPLKTMYVNPEREEKHPVKYFLQACGNCAAGSAFILEGPKSVGKNVFCETLAFLFNKEYFVIQLNENTSDGDVYGEKSTDNSAAKKITMENALAYMQSQALIAQGKEVPEDLLEKATEYELNKSLAASVKIIQDLGIWVQWLQRGGIMVLNEMDMADANFFSQLVNMILDGTGFMTVPGYGRVDVNPECILIGTQNGSEYAGTNQQNTASISRFDKYILPQPQNIIGQLKSACNGRHIAIDEKYLIACNAFYQDLRRMASAEAGGQISDTCLNIRGIVRALEQVSLFEGEVTLSERLKLSVVNACPEDEHPLILSVLRNKIGSL